MTWEMEGLLVIIIITGMQFQLPSIQAKKMQNIMLVEQEFLFRRRQENLDQRTLGEDFKEMYLGPIW